MKTLVDSSGWIEFFAGGPLADRYAAYLKDPERVVTPTIVAYEVFKKIRRERGEEAALRAAAQLEVTQVIPLTEPIARLAAELSLQHGLAMAGAVIYATTQDQDAQLVTGDADLKDLPRVVYLK